MTGETMEQDTLREIGNEDREWLWDRWADGEEEGRMAAEARNGGS